MQFPFSPRLVGVVLLVLLVVFVATIPVSGVLSGQPPTSTPTIAPTSTATVTATVTPTATLTPVTNAPATVPPTTAPSATVTASATIAPTTPPTPTPVAAPMAREVGNPATGYWHTAGNRIVDSHGRTVRIAAVNWFGMENVYYVPAGLDRRPLNAITARVQALGFNAIRLPFSNQLVEQNPIVKGHLEANPDLRGLHALQILDRIVAAAGHHHLRIILDDGRSNIGTPPQENGLWYTRTYPESAWIRDWVRLALRYAGNPTVVAVDLRNEPHTAGPGPWSLRTYLHQGSTWGPYNGVDNPATDWRLAAERAGNAVLRVNPHVLIMVEGLQMYPDLTRPRGVDTYWWGGVLQPAGRYPVRLVVPHRLVYSPHEYGPYKVPMWFFTRASTYAAMSAVWNKHWGYLQSAANRSPVPIFIGEFGNCPEPSCYASSVPGSTGLWFTFFTRYLRTHPNVGWAFWALNGTNHRGVDMTNYLLEKDWSAVRLPYLVRALRSVGLAPTAAASSRSTAVTPSP